MRFRYLCFQTRLTYLHSANLLRQIGVFSDFIFYFRALFDHISLTLARFIIILFPL